MDHAEKLARIKTMLRQVAPHHDLESLQGTALPDNESTESAASFTRRTSTSVPVGAAQAVEGVRKLKEDRDRDVSPSELLALEAIILPKMRPVAFVRRGTYDKIKAPWEWLDGSAVRARINPLLGSIGRIELPFMQSVPYAGTGFLVGRGLLMTNRHVAQLFAEGVGRGARLRYRPGDAGVDFKREAFAATDNSSYFTINQVVMIHPYWDMALLRVEGLSPTYRPLTLATLSPDELVDRDVVVVGYPARDPRNDASVQDSVFEGVYNVKRLQPGRVGKRSALRSFDYEVSAMQHDASTLGGDSGAAVIDVESGHVIGLHFAGEYLKANFAVPSYELARDARVVDTELVFSGSVPFTNQWDDAWQAAGDDQAPPVRDQAARPAQPAAARTAPTAAAPAGGVEIPITVRITVDAGNGAQNAAMGYSSGAGRDESVRRSGRVSMRQLQEMMRDPDIDDAMLRQYFVASAETSKPFAPAVLPNPELVDVAAPTDTLEGAMMMGWANDLSRMRRQSKFKARRNAGDTRPVLVSEGDSWFQFPVMLADVIDQLQRDYNVWSVDSAGDTLLNMVQVNAEYMKAIRAQAGSVRAFLFSGGGNDIVGEDAQGRPVISQIVRRFEAGRPAQWYLGSEALERKMDFIEQCYQAVIANVAHEFPRLPIVCHGYDYAIPGGGPDDTRRPMWAAQDKWIGRAMREDLGIVDPRLQREIVALLIDRLNQILQRLCGGGNREGTFRNAWHIDLRRKVNGRWADELHPTDDGFAAVADSFRSVLGQVLQQTTEMWGGVAATPVHGYDGAREGLGQLNHIPVTAPYGDGWNYPGQQQWRH